MQEKVSENGIFSAVGFVMIGTIGHFLTQYQFNPRLDLFWLAMFLLAILTLSGAVVNFDPKRMLK